MKNLTAIGKSFRTLVIASLLSSSVAHAQFSAGDSVTGPLDPGTTWFSFVTNLINYRGGLLDSNDKRIYSAVRGQMRVVYGYQTSNGYCRVYQSEVYNNGNAKSWQEYACRSEDQPQWKFYNK